MPLNPMGLQCLKEVSLGQMGDAQLENSKDKKGAHSSEEKNGMCLKGEMKVHREIHQTTEMFKRNVLKMAARPSDGGQSCKHK